MLSKKNYSLKDKAQAMVEFAIALPLLLLLLYGILETGRYLFLYSTVVTASRQAARYGSATGEGAANNVPRYQDCDGMRNAANNAGFLGAFDTISIQWDKGPNTTQTTYCTGSTDTTSLTSGMLEDNAHRVVVTVKKQFTPLVKLVPFTPQLISATSSRTILSSVAIVVTVPPQLTVQDPTTIQIVDSPDPSGLNEPVTVTVTVTNTVDPSTIPTGDVIINWGDSGNTTCTITLVNGTGDTSGCAPFAYTALGNFTITATYTGDNTNQPSNISEGHTVDEAPTTTTITADSPDPSQTNATVNVSVTVTSAWGTPTGTVTITGADTNCTITLSGGSGSCNVTFTSTGTKTLTATYNGDPQHRTSSDTEDHDVLADRQTVTRITTDAPDPSEIGQTVTVYVTVVGLTTPTGVVNITGADSNCQITLTNGSGNCNVVFNTVGTKILTANYVGDTNHDPSSDTEAHTVVLHPTVTSITAHTPDPSVAGETVNVTVTVTGGSPVPTGTVAITGADTNCTITLDINGTGNCDVIFSSSGTKTLVATYNGDSLYATSNSTATHSVTAQPVTGCDPTNVYPGLLTKSGNTMSVAITNQLNVNLQVQDVTVQWNHDKGHQTGSDKTLRLQSASAGGNTFWGPADDAGASLTIVPTTAVFITANGQTTFTFTFHQSYDNWDNTEYVSINLSNPGCESVNPIYQNKH